MGSPQCSQCAFCGKGLTQDFRMGMGQVEPLAKYT